MKQFFQTLWAQTKLVASAIKTAVVESSKALWVAVKAIWSAGTEQASAIGSGVKSVGKAAKNGYADAMQAKRNLRVEVEPESVTHIDPSKVEVVTA